MDEAILITGGCGFVGSNLAVKLKKDFPKTRVIAFDNLHRRGSELNLKRLADVGVEFVHGDIRNKEDFEALGDITVVIEAAAEPSVMSGIQSSTDYVFNTNLFGTLNCLNFARKQNSKFLFLSTSRVYPISKLNRIRYAENATRFELLSEQSEVGVSRDGISEEFSLIGARSFYGTSKLSSEFLIQEFTEFYGLPSIINRCGVITGPWQMGKVDQGFLVLWLAKHFWKKKLAYIGFGGLGKQVRDMIHIEDLYSLVKIQLGDFGKYQSQTFNVGGGKDVSVSLLELTELCRKITGNVIDIESVEVNRVGDIPIYISDCDKISKLNQWHPTHSVGSILEDTFEWLLKNESILKPILT
jgi:CDP-paratose 2-epimerase